MTEFRSTLNEQEYENISKHLRKNLPNNEYIWMNLKLLINPIGYMHKVNTPFLISFKFFNFYFE